MHCCAHVYIGKIRLVLNIGPPKRLVCIGAFGGLVSIGLFQQGLYIAIMTHLKGTPLHWLDVVHIFPTRYALRMLITFIGLFGK